jgi:uncharacterized protein
VHSKKLAVLAAAGALAAPAAAQAHVTVQPKTAPAGAFTVLDVRVPNERDKASTIKVDVQFPDGFAAVSYQPVPGWKVRVITKKLAKPIQTDDGPVSEGVSRMIWTGNRTQGRIAPGQFMDFPVSVKVPGKAGDTLTFKALQTYSDGDVVRWIGAPNADEPAPQVKVTGAVSTAGMSHGAMSGTSATTTPPAHTTAAKGLSPVAIAALIVGGLALLGGLASFGLSRRRRERPAATA